MPSNKETKLKTKQFTSDKFEDVFMVGYFYILIYIYTIFGKRRWIFGIFV